MITRDELIEIGAYNKPHGINGEISATFDYNIDIIQGLTCFVSEVNGIFVPFFAEGLRSKNNQTMLMKIEGFQNEKEVKLLVNREIYALKTEMSVEEKTMDEDDELPLDYFIGFSIEDKDAGIIGEIIDVDDSTENLLFIVDRNDSSTYIPAVDEFIESIDFEKKTLLMALPSGILHLGK